MPFTLWIIVCFRGDGDGDDGDVADAKSVP